MRDFIGLDATPYEENCEQLGENYNPTKARQECKVFVNQLRRMFGPEPGNSRLQVNANFHDFGTYFLVFCYFDSDNPDEVEYAFRLEAEMPARWDEEAIEELNCF